MPLNIDATSGGAARRIAVEGEIDLYTSPELRTALLDAFKQSNPRVVINLAQVAYMDSSGVATLVEGLKQAAKHGREFIIESPSQAVLKVLQLSKLDSVFNIQEQGAPE